LENPNVAGDYSGNWAAAGTAGFQLVDKYLGWATAAGKVLAIQINERIFGSGTVNPNTGNGTVPNYLGTLANGAGGWYARPAGQTWAGNLAFVVKLDNVAVMQRYNALVAAYGARYDSNPAFAVLETSETAVGAPSWISSQYNANLLTIINSWRASCPTTGLRLAANFINPGATEFNTLFDACKPQKWMVGGPDSEYPFNGPPFSGGGAITAPDVYRGADGNLIDYRSGTLPWDGEIQANGLGSTVKPVNVYDENFNVPKMSYMNWVWYNPNGNFDWATQVKPFLDTVNWAVANPNKPAGW
jgi:hypothetical protein